MRSIAVVGSGFSGTMVAAHLLWIDDFDFADAATWVAVVDGRSSIVFATLAGVSIGLVTGGTRPLPQAEMNLARSRLAVRSSSSRFWKQPPVNATCGWPTASATATMAAARPLWKRPAIIPEETPLRKSCTSASISGCQSRRRGGAEGEEGKEGKEGK